ncbi:hypothetical protein NDU88_004247 [Pleurodeles waltl]|uniref:Uncharacterized protein n=1 Tax=Pleurodeles waltl TaxID=8319 RepID=A0AAV7LKW6_PLEWA|nr:hypothetical protein NDU88_004247 [Pleurodeles waltl]
MARWLTPAKWQLQWHTANKAGPCRTEPTPRSRNIEGDGRHFLRCMRETIEGVTDPALRSGRTRTVR